MPIAQLEFDNRRDEQFPIARAGAETFTIVSGTTQTKASHLNGRLLGYIYTIPNLTTDTTWTLEILDKDGCILYSKTDLVDNKPTTPFVYYLTDTELIWLFGNVDIRVTYTTSQTATIVVVPILK